MACGIPVIATNWSGPVEFVDESNGYLIDYKMVRVDEGAFVGHEWADPSAEHLSSIMREVHENHEGARIKGEKGKRDVEERWNMMTMGQAFLDLVYETVEEVVEEEERRARSEGQTGGHDEL
jgi:glycosyltransferase involved in cell wall biosynthesis